MASVIYTYGGGEVLFKVFNGVALLFSSKNGIAQNIITFMTAVALMWAAIEGIRQGSFKPQLNWMVKYIIIMMLVITPKGTVWINDTVTNSRFKIDNIPIGLYIPASLISTVGYGVTKSFEQAFSIPNDLNYTSYGNVFGASLISNVRNFKIQDANFRENMESYISECIMYEVGRGYNFTPRELKDSTDIWELYKTKVLSKDRFRFREKDGMIKSTACAEGANKLEEYWKDDIDNILTRMSSRILKRRDVTSSAKASRPSESLSKGSKNDNNSISTVFKKSFESTLMFFGNKNHSAEKNIKQLMLINALKDNPVNYGSVRAMQQQKDTWITVGTMARENLPIMHAIFTSIVYASFALILGLLVMPGGFRALGSYIVLLAWVELWPPLFAVFNMIINSQSKGAGLDIMEGFTMRNLNDIVTIQGSIAAQAGYYMISIPFIAYTIVKGGAGQFVHLAGQITGATQGAAASASNEVTTGNRSFDNTSIANQQMYNQSSNKTDLNSMVRTGHQEYQRSDGALVKTTADGNTIFQAGSGLTSSVGTRAMEQENSQSSVAQMSLSHEQSMMEAEQKELASTKVEVERKAAEFMGRLGVNQSSAQNSNYSTSSNDSTAAIDIREKGKDLHDNFSYSYNQGREYGVGANVGGKLSTAGLKPTGGLSNVRGAAGDGIAGSMVGEEAPQGFWGKTKDIIKKTGEASLGGDANFKYSRGARNEQTYAENNTVGVKENYTGNIEKAYHAAKETQFSDSQVEEKALAESFASSYEKMEQLHESIGMHKQKIDRWQETVESSKAASYHSRKEDYDHELKFIANKEDKYGFKHGMHGAQRIIEQGGEEYDKLHREYASKHLNQQYAAPNSYDESIFNFKTRSEMIKDNIDDTKLNAFAEQKKETEFKGGSVVSNEASSMVADELAKQDHKIAQRNINNTNRMNNLQQKVDAEEDSRVWKEWIGREKTKEPVDD